MTEISWFHGMGQVARGAEDVAAPSASVEESWLFGPLDNPRRLAVLVLAGVWVFILGYAIGRSMTVEERTVEVVKALEGLEGVK